MIEASIKVNPTTSKLQRVLCMYDFTQFRPQAIEALIDSSSEVNVIQPSFMKHLGLYVYQIDVGTHRLTAVNLKYLA